MIFKPGDKVKFSNPENEDEASLVMIVLEDRDARVLVETPIESMRYTPQMVYDKTDLSLL